MNGYPSILDPTFVPPGWDEWYSPSGGSPYWEFNYDLNENGVIVSYGNNPQDYMVDVLSVRRPISSGGSSLRVPNTLPFSSIWPPMRRITRQLRRLGTKTRSPVSRHRARRRSMKRT